MSFNSNRSAILSFLLEPQCNCVIFTRTGVQLCHFYSNRSAILSFYSNRSAIVSFFLEPECIFVNFTQTGVQFCHFYSNRRAILSFVLKLECDPHKGLNLWLLQAGSSTKPQFPSESNAHAVYDRYTLKYCARVRCAPAEPFTTVFFFFFLLDFWVVTV